MLIGGGSLIILVTLLLTVGLGTSAEFMVVIGASSSSVYVSDPTGPALPTNIVSYKLESGSCADGNRTCLMYLMMKECLR